MRILSDRDIRYTHFSRNPKIAEFLKAYNFVKEYGEGVNRMCKELESAGLKDPAYYTNAFMLQVVIYNTNIEKSVVEKVADSLGKLAIEVNKSAVDARKSEFDEMNYNEPTTEDESYQIFELLNYIQGNINSPEYSIFSIYRNKHRQEDVKEFNDRVVLALMKMG